MDESLEHPKSASKRSNKGVVFQKQQWVSL